jgi:hypothetical protein
VKIGVCHLLGLIVQEGVAEWMLVEGVHDLACDGRGGLDINIEIIQGDILSQADALPDCMKLIRLSKATLGFSCSSLSLVVGSNEAPEPLCAYGYKKKR